MPPTRSPTLKLVTNAFYTQEWAILPEMYDRISQIIDERVQGLKPDLAELEARIDGQTYGTSGSADTTGAVALLTLHGPIISRAGMMDTISGATSPQMFASLVRAAADDARVGHIVLSIDSPGGTVSGTQTAAEAVSYAVGKKPVTAVVDDLACSAALWIAVQASEVVIPSSGTLGSIGVIGTHVDRSKALADAGLKHTVIRSTPGKALGQPSEHMTGAALSQTQARMDALHGEFVRAVASGRGVPLETAQAWGTGETWLGQAAVDVGLADRLGTLASVLAELTAEDPAEPENTPLFNPDSAPDDAARADPPSDPPSDAPPATPEATASPEDSMNVQAITAKLTAGQPLTAEERAFLNAHLDGQAQAAATPDMSTWPAEARAMFEQAQASATAANAAAAAAQATATAERDIRLNREYTDRALALGQPVEFGATLRALHESNPEAATAAENALRAAQAATNLTATLGSSANVRPGAAAPADRIEARAAELMAQGVKGDVALERAMQELGTEAAEYTKEVRA